MNCSVASAKRASAQARAFTVVEVVIAVAIISIMFASLYVGIAFGFSVTNFDRENLRATQILLERMEGIRLFRWDQLTDTNLNPTTFVESYYPVGLENTSGEGINYTGTMSVADATLTPTASYSTNLKQITVTVSWTSGSVTRTRSMTTYAGKHGVQNYIYNN